MKTVPKSCTILPIFSNVKRSRFLKHLALIWNLFGEKGFGKNGENAEDVDDVEDGDGDDDGRHERFEIARFPEIGKRKTISYFLILEVWFKNLLENLAKCRRT